MRPALRTIADSLSSRADPRAADRLRVLTGIAALVMLGLSWPLWAAPDVFPTVPFVAGVAIPAPASGALFGLMLLGAALAAAGRFVRPALAGFVAAAAVLVAADQHRFQPWIYQFGLTALALAVCRPAEAVTLCRLFALGLYLHSGLGKLDISFIEGNGRQFLWALGGGGLPEPLAVPLILAMPIGEILVAAGLLIPATRRAAVIAAVVQHGLLIAILGPWGLGHRPIVLIWNLYFALADIVLFWQGYKWVAGAERSGELCAVGLRPSDAPQGADRAAGASLGEDAADASNHSRSAPATRSVGCALVRFLFAAAVLMPFTERWGLWDSWPSFGLYAGHDDRTYVTVRAGDARALPPELADRLGPAVDGWRPLDIAEWSRSVRGTSPYPSNRAQLGIAIALCDRFPSVRWRVVQLGPASPLLGSRERVELDGADAIRRRADDYWLNATPAGGAKLHAAARARR